jgi:hypothetical protein
MRATLRSLSLAGASSAWLFSAGLLGAALLAVAIVPLSTAYSVAETFGTESQAR